LIDKYLLIAKAKKDFKAVKFVLTLKGQKRTKKDKTNEYN